MITIDMTKAKDIAHEKRREARAKEFAPLDEIIMKQLPGVDAQATEAARQAIRDKYETMQNQINSCSNIKQLKAIILSND